jgi:hypothetical protein
MKSSLSAAKPPAKGILKALRTRVPFTEFERVAHIIERGLTGEPMFASAPELLGALRHDNGNCWVRVRETPGRCQVGLPARIRRVGALGSGGPLVGGFD